MSKRDSSALGKGLPHERNSIPTSPTKYRLWWESHTSIPYGYCWCGCGEETNVPRYSSPALGRVQGEPMRFLRGHHTGHQRFTSEEYRERKRAKDRAYYKANKQRAIENAARWKAANRERARELARLYWSRKRASGGTHTPDEIWQMVDDQQGLCAYCETPLFGTYHIDHMIPVSRGGTDDWTNLAIACPTCNISKSARTVEEFMDARQRYPIR